MIRPATVADIPFLVTRGPAYLREAAAGGTYSPEAAERSFRSMLAQEGYRVLVSDTDGQIDGIAILAVDRAWTAEPWGYIQSFYVDPKMRGVGIGRDLMKAAASFFDAAGCAATYALGTGDDRLFGNLAAKFGFKPEGRVFMRSAHA